MKTIRLQHRTYLGKDRKTKYVQHRTNIPDYIIKRLGWKQEDQIILNVNTKKKIIILEELRSKTSASTLVTVHIVYTYIPISMIVFRSYS
ncbi:hypothetical protein [Nitrosopumilus sp.]|uniref:hypothetical protein n=1 Tax=Nitrosopumilus sp. TaxID=2024843 RepID=UPI00292FA885|nr:hypothetical protein [Nitrosopumilus sp.]